MVIKRHVTAGSDSAWNGTRAGKCCCEIGIENPFCKRAPNPVWQYEKQYPHKAARPWIAKSQSRDHFHRQLRYKRALSFYRWGRGRKCWTCSLVQSLEEDCRCRNASDCTYSIRNQYAHGWKIEVSEVDICRTKGTIGPQLEPVRRKREIIGSLESNTWDSEVSKSIETDLQKGYKFYILQEN